jgi:hypothetical protein
MKNRWVIAIAGIFTGALHVIAAVMAISLVLPVVVSPPQRGVPQKLTPDIRPRAAA